MQKIIPAEGKSRDSAIDILKFIAVFFITWSHFDAPLGKYEALATGGAFGDSLFFFMSGYTLLLSNRRVNFLNWYKRRINRIYPTVFAWALVAAVFLGGGSNMKDILLHGGGFFVTCIMLFYLMFYPIKRYVPIAYWGGVMVVYFLIYGAFFFLLDQSSHSVAYRWQWSGYFLSMLAGALVGRRRKEGKNTLLSSWNKWVIMLCLLFSAALYYALLYLGGRFAPLAILNIIPLVGFAYLLFELCCRKLPNRLYQKDWIHWIVRFMGGLCLEIYIVQPSIITDKMNGIFPWNLLVIFVAIIIAAYLLRTLGRIWTQTFKEEDYNWKEIIAPY